ncbi:MAG TPA: hypothetical protein PKC43_13935 [Phycisphaerales bacterium]|nr:hypothetical protein [Phycisphaerales bacterium]HMP38534.1 hypothetical protein [Phycisphaerales bacterium]
MRRTIPLFITTAAGVVLVVAYFVPWMSALGETVSTWFNILAAIAFILGGGNLMKMNLRKISDRVPGWGYSVVTLVAFVVTLAVGLAKVGVNPLPEYPSYAWSGEFNEQGSAFWWIYEYTWKPLTATMFAMLAFYVASAAFRAFRAKNIEATLLLGTAFLILLGRTYAGVWLTSWLPEDSPLRIELLSEFVMETFTTTGTRAIMIGVALGVVATSLRILLGVDRSHLGSGRN